MKKFIWKMMVSLLIVFIVGQPICQLLGIYSYTYARTMNDTLDNIKKSLKSYESYTILHSSKKYRVTYNGELHLKSVPKCFKEKFFYEGGTLDTNISGVKAKISSVDSDEVGKKRHTVNTTKVHSSEMHYNLVVHLIATFVTSTSYSSTSVPGSLPNVTVSGNYGTYSEVSFDKVKLTLDPHGWQAVDNSTDRYQVNIYDTRPSTSSNSNNYVASTTKQEIINEVQNNSWNNSWEDSGNGWWEESYQEPVAVEVDKEINLNNEQKRLYIRTIYRRALKRDPRGDEYENFMANGTPQEIGINVILSDESNNKNKINSLSNQEFVKCCYRLILGREGDSGGINAHTAALNNRTRDRAKTIKAFYNSSDEFSNHFTRTVKKIELDEGLCNAIYNDLTNKGFEVCKLDSKNILMFEGDISKVTSLDIGGKSLTNLNGLSVFTNLNKLVAQNNKLTDISGIEKLSKLTYLNLNNNELKNNVTPVFSLTQLNELYLDNNGLIYNYISNISKLSNLKKISLNNNSLTTINSVSGIASLKELYADNNKISTIGNIKVDKISLKNQAVAEEGFSTEFNNMDIIKYAKDKNSLLYTDKDFVCQDCKYENGKVILNLNSNKGTVTIKGGLADGTVCTYNNISRKIEFNDKVLADRVQKEIQLFVRDRRDENGKYYIYVPNTQVKYVQNINLSATASDSRQITDITGLENFENLKSINLTNNKVSNLDKLSALKNLETLTIKNNGLTNLNSIKNIKSLKQLDASHNEITDISGLSGLTNLENVILDSNKIGNNIAPLNSLSKLSVLSLSDNGVSSLQNIKDLKLSELFASHNFISDFTPVKNDGKNTIEAMNNIVTIEVDGTECDIPDIVKMAMEKNGGVNCLELKNCTINNNKVVLGKYQTDAQIKIIKGESSDTIINIKSKKYITPPVVKTSYTNVSKGVKVTLQIDRHIFDLWGWTRDDDTYTKYSKVFEYNVENQKVTVKDGHGNKTDVLINISSIQNDRVPGLKVTYSETAPTRDNVTVTISADVRLGDPITPGWTLSQDKKSMSCTFTENNDGGYGKTVPLENDTSGQPTMTVPVNVDNIDKTAPACTVEYSQTETTKSSVVATIWSNEDIQLAGNNAKFIGKTLKLNNIGKTIYGLSFLYTKNESENNTVVDAAGNSAIVNVSVRNIDNKVDGLNAVSSGVAATNQNQRIRIYANEKIALSTVNVTIARKGLNFAKRFYESETDLPILKVATTTPIMMLAENETAETDSENEISIDATEGDYGVLRVADNTGNTELVMYNTNNIDKTGPVISVENEETQNDGSVLVTLLASEQIQKTEDLTGWELSEDGLRLSKIFKSNQKEKVVVKDLAGNEGSLDLDVKSVNAIKNQVDYEPIENTDYVLVVISADREIKPVDGWRLLEDKKAIAKALKVDEDETVLIEDYDGYGSTVYVSAYESLKNEEKPIQTDDTQATEVLPQTGKYMVFVLITSMILVIITTITLINYSRKYND